MGTARDLMSTSSGLNCFLEPLGGLVAGGGKVSILSPAVIPPNIVAQSLSPRSLRIAAFRITVLLHTSLGILACVAVLPARWGP